MFRYRIYNIPVMFEVLFCFNYHIYIYLYQLHMTEIFFYCSVVSCIKILVECGNTLGIPIERGVKGQFKRHSKGQINTRKYY